MSGYDDRRDDRRDDRDDDGDDDRRGGDRPLGRAEAGRRRLSTPGLLLILAGVFGALAALGYFAAAVTSPYALHDAMVDMANKGPDGPERQKQLDDLAAKKESNRLDAPLNLASGGLGLVLNLLAIAGGVSMRSASSYGLSMAGAIAAIIPASGCCCVTMPIGIWALVVLLNNDAKAAFAAKRRTPYPD